MADLRYAQQESYRIRGLNSKSPMCMNSIHKHVSTKRKKRVGVGE